MITVTKIRELRVARATPVRRLLHLSAASGLVRAGAWLYVVADDELQLGVFPFVDAAPGTLIRLFAGELPGATKARKKTKPDLEVLLRLPAFAGYPAGALLALGSGSRPSRRRGVLFALATSGELQGKPRVIELGRMYEALEREFSGLNIEGAVTIGEELLLLQRGNKGDAINACIHLSLPEMLNNLQSGDAVGVMKPIRIRHFDLGAVDGVPLCFSDASALDGDRFVFTAIAENTADNYHDGPCAGAAIGIAGLDGSTQFLQRLEYPHKIEGVAVISADGPIRLLLVTDADDANIAASLLTAEIELSSL